MSWKDNNHSHRFVVLAVKEIADGYQLNFQLKMHPGDVRNDYPSCFDGNLCPVRRYKIYDYVWF